MPLAWKPNEFKIAVNMAGAISAGAYTAGVLDFLMEALEQWQAAKDAYSKGVAGAPPVPLHDVSIEAFSGASAGGMCAAIASVMVQGSFQHIPSPVASGTNNTFYEAWVNRIDISRLLTTTDIDRGGPLVSLLDSSIIDDIATEALTLGLVTRRPYIADTLTLFLTLTNVRGTHYQLYSDPAPTVNEFTTYYADRIRFETTTGGRATMDTTAKPLPLDHPGTGAWPLLQDAAKATGAFPIFLAPRILNRDLSDYDVPGWARVGAPDPHILPDLPVPPPHTITTLNIDGGVTDNDPFQLGHDFLANQNPKATDNTNPRAPLDANCAVISVAPFPSEERFDPAYDVKAARDLFTMLVRMFTVTLSQSRFLGESLEVLTSGAAFSRFVIAPSDPSLKNRNALQCSALGAFGGFMERSFRAHDFMLGRYNCQAFLRRHFCLPLANPIIAAGQSAAGAGAPAIEARFAVDPPPGVTGGPQGKVWMPIIPLVGTADAALARPQRGTITKDKIDGIADATLDRLDAVKDGLLDGAPAAWLLKRFVGLLCTWPVRPFVRRTISDKLAAAFGPDVHD
jgi:hypothetical protein